MAIHFTSWHELHDASRELRLAQEANDALWIHHAERKWAEALDRLRRRHARRVSQAA